MGTDNFLAGVLLATTINCHAAAIGVVSVTGNGETQVHTLSQLKPADEIRIQYLDANGNARCCTRLEGRSFVPIAAITAVSNALTGDSLFSYRLRAFPNGMHGRLFVGAPLIGAGQSQRNRSGLAASRSWRRRFARQNMYQSGRPACDRRGKPQSA